MFGFGKRVPFFLIVLATLLFSTVEIYAQTETARVQGTVTDATGAAVAGATVKATAVATNRTVEIQTNEEGGYSILTLQPGQYRLEVTQANFKTTRQDVTLEVAQNATLDFALEAGDVSAVVEVTAEAPIVDTSSSAIGNVVSGRQAVELPLNGRNVLELARLSPGVTQGYVGGFASGAGGDAETYRGGNVGGAAISVNGQRTQANNYLLDGVDNNESLVNTINIFPSAEAIQEFRVQTSVAQAEFGRGGGAIINSVVKSGTNDFHGSSYLFIRNNVFDARPTFFDARPTSQGGNGRRIAPFRRGQFGATVGGPVILPGFGEGVPVVNNLKDKVFFFFSYDGLRQFLPRSTDTATVPTLAFRNGDFSELLTQGIQLRDPLTGANIPGNRIDLLPGNRINQAGLNYLRAFPLPTRAGVRDNYVNTRNELLQQDVFDLRVDANINDRNQMFVRGSYGKFDQTVTSRLTTLPSGFGSGTNPTRTRGIVVGLNSSLTGNLFNELRLQANRIQYGYEPPFGDQPISSSLGIANANRDSSLGGGALIGGYNGQLEYTGDYGPYRVPQNTYQIVDSIGYTTGDHTFRFGGTILKRNVQLFRPLAGKGDFRMYGNGSFNECPNGGAAPSLAQSGTTRWEQADLLIGFFCTYDIGIQLGNVGTINWENALFAQDDWRVSQNLTLNLGMRYEYLTNPAEEYGRQANFDLSTGRLNVATDGKDTLTNTDKNNFGPRIGFAYDISGKGKSVIRGGYGLFYFLDRGGISNQLAQNPPYSGSLRFFYNDGYRITFSGQGDPNNPSNDNRLATRPLPLPQVNLSQSFLNNPTNANVLAVRPDNKTSNVQQFNVQFQQQLFENTAVSVGYVGTRGRNLILYYNLNGAIVDPAFAAPCPISSRTLGNCYPGVGSVNVRGDIGKSSYDSLQVQLERRYSQGWQFLAAYTFSKTKDNGEGAFDASDRGNRNFLEPFGTSRLDYPHVFSFQTVYDLPFGRGRKIGSDIPRALDFIIGGWQINAIYRAQSGTAFDIRNGGIRVDVTGDPYGENETGNPYLNRTAFRAVPLNAGRFGNLERNSLRSPSTSQLNLGLTKNFQLYESFKLQLRAEGFNVLNTPQFNRPETNCDAQFEQSQSNYLGCRDTSLGTIRTIVPFTNRQLQFGLRLEF
ncbi:MAG TPA: carboxypeptidase-like regulatory domain-containing protein [Pyrinomonadaceae bacterium]|jgi:hypothetical protein